MRWSSMLVAVLLLTTGLAGCLASTSDPTNTTGEDPLTPAGNQTSDQAQPGTTESSDENSTEEARNESRQRNTTSSSGDPDQQPPEDPEEAKQPPWPPVEEASVRPGVQVIESGSQCTSNFLFRTPDNATLFLGVAAHCVADGAQNNVNGCDEDNEPLEPGSPVRIEGASEPGTLVYSAWHTMQQVGESNDAVCRGNDFALIAIDPGDRGKVHPAVRHFGGPTGLVEPGQASIGDKVVSYGNSNLRGGLEASNHHEGYLVETGTWSVQAYTVTPGVPGDSGSGVLDADGRALGVLSTVELSPRPASNGIAVLSSALAYAQQNAGLNVELVTWQSLTDGNLPG